MDNFILMKYKMVTDFATDSQNNSDWKESLGFSIQPASQIKIGKVSLYYTILYQAGHQNVQSWTLQNLFHLSQ